MVKQKEVLKSLGVTKTDSCIHYGRKRKLVRYSHGMTEEEAEKLTASRREERRASDSNQADQQRDDELVGDETESYDEVIFGQRRPDSLAIDWTNHMVYVLGSNVRQIKGEIIEKKGNRVQGFSMTC